MDKHRHLHRIYMATYESTQLDIDREIEFLASILRSPGSLDGVRGRVRGGGTPLIFHRANCGHKLGATMELADVAYAGFAEYAGLVTRSWGSTEAVFSAIHPIARSGARLRVLQSVEASHS